MVLRIEIDDEVYAEMASLVHGAEQPNDVLRRVLLKGRPVSAVVEADSRVCASVESYQGRHRTRA